MSGNKRTAGGEKISEKKSACVKETVCGGDVPEKVREGRNAAKSSLSPLTAKEFSEVMKKKGSYAVSALIAAAVWVILLVLFPFPFYSLFFASNLGSNVLLIFMAAVLSLPVNWAFSKALKTDIKGSVFFAVNVIMLLGVVYVYSIFRYTGVVWLVLTAAVHWAVTAAVFLHSRVCEGRKIKGSGRLALMGAVCAALSEFLYLLMFTLLLNVFRE